MLYVRGAKGGRCSSGTALLVLVALSCGGSEAYAQSEGGSIGGSIGGSTGGSVGGNIGMPAKPVTTAPAPRSPAAIVRRPVVEPQRQRVTRVEPQRRRSPYGERARGPFDGTWSLSTASSCAGNGSGVFRVSGSRLFARNAAGSVSPAGSVYSTERFRGMTSVYTGRLYGNTGSGSYQRVDGCTGQWSAAR